MGMFDSYLANAISLIHQVTERLDRITIAIESIRSDNAYYRSRSTIPYAYQMHFDTNMVDGNFFTVPFGEVWLVDYIGCDTYWELTEDGGLFIANFDAVPGALVSDKIHLVAGREYRMKCGAPVFMQATRVMIDNKPKPVRTGGEGGFVNGAGQPMTEVERNTVTMAKASVPQIKK